MRIAFTHAFCWPEVRRGGERYLHELAGALARRDHDVTVIAGAKRWSLRTEDGVRFIRVGRPTGGSVSDAERHFAHRALAVLLSSRRFDVVHSLGPRDAVSALRSRRHGRTVYTQLGLPKRASWEKLPAGRAHARVVDEIDVYGCLSAHAQELLRSDFARPGALTPGGVSLARFRPGRRVSEPTLLFTSSLDEPRKGLATLLSALAILAEREPGVQLWLSGPGDASALLARAPAAAQQRTHVLPIGTPEDISELYASAWATVLPSTNEAFGLTLVESLACGTPIVGADHAGLPELVEPPTGSLATPGDASSLADACTRALTLAAEAGTAERCREAARRHDWDTVVAPAIEALYLGKQRDRSA